MDNPLVDFGNAPLSTQTACQHRVRHVGHPGRADSGLFEYLYGSDGLTLLPHIPPGITELRQLDPIRSETKSCICLPWERVGQRGDRQQQAMEGLQGGVCASTLQWYTRHCRDYHRVGRRPIRRSLAGLVSSPREVTDEKLDSDLAGLARRLRNLEAWRKQLAQIGRGEEYEAAHARVIEEMITAAQKRRMMQATGKLARLPDASQTAADQSYIDAITKLSDGLKPSSGRTRKRPLPVVSVPDSGALKRAPKARDARVAAASNE